MLHPSIHKRKTIPLAILSAMSINHHAAAEPSTAKIVTAPVVVTATRIEQNSFDLPVSIDVVNQNDIQDAQLKMTLSESLIRVPGITAQNRSQFSQDPQISTRGFGSRSSFGVRGLRIYVDGIPFSMPDGIGQPGNIDLSTVKSIEVMRGPFSSLYGNSSGGVIQLLTEDAPKTPEVSTELMMGSYGTNRQNISVSGTEDIVEYSASYSNFETDGYRKNSDAKKEQFTAKLKFNFTDATKLTMLANWLDMDAQDPLGLPRADTTSGSLFQPSAFSNPKGVPNVAYLANTRVSRKNEQIGFNLEHAFDENNAINLISYLGNRKNTQYLSLYSSTATSAPANRIDGGRASIIDRDFWGGEIRYNHKGLILDRPYNITAGYSYGEMKDARSDINAYGGVMQDETNLTNVNRNEKNIAHNYDKYVQAQWAALDNFDIHAGVRKTKISLEVDDKLVDLTKDFTKTFNLKYRDSSGNLSFEKTTPVIGAVWKINPSLNLYANYGKGFETPTLIEIAYDSAGGTGPNLALKPSESDNYEIGVKAFANEDTRINAAIFRTNTEKEIVVTQSGTYPVYENAGKTKRQGLEISVDSQLPNNFGLYGAYTYLDAEFDSSFISSNGLVNSGNHIPGTYREQIYGEVSWKAPAAGFSTAFEARYNSKVYIDDRNTDIAPSYTIFNLRAGFKQSVKNWNFSEYVRIENLFDKEYIGSVRVNDSNSRYFEPAPGRNYILGVSAGYSFK